METLYNHRCLAIKYMAATNNDVLHDTVDEAVQEYARAFASL